MLEYRHDCSDMSQLSWEGACMWIEALGSRETSDWLARGAVLPVGLGSGEAVMKPQAPSHC